MITFRCGRCAEWVRAEEASAGRGVPCQRCGHVNICPAASPASPHPGSRPASARPGPASSSPSPAITRVLWPVLVTVVLGGAAWMAWSELAGPDKSRTAPAAASPAEALQSRLLRADIDQPADPILEAKFTRVNAEHFGAALPVIAVRWEPGLAQVGPLAAHAFTLEGMFGHIGGRKMILLNPSLQGDDRELQRALCHEMVHAYLYVTGDTATNHGPAFQAVLHRLSEEGAFEGIPATDEERASLRAWLDAESARLDTEQQSMDALHRDMEAERAALERAVADMNVRVAAANTQGGGPSASEVDALNARRDAYNRNAVDANARAAQDQADLDHFNKEVARYNLMLVYPDGLDENALVAPRSPLARPGGQ